VKGEQNDGVQAHDCPERVPDKLWRPGSFTSTYRDRRIAH
jgi:hypothetical protein